MGLSGQINKTATARGSGTLTVADLRQLLVDLPAKARLTINQTNSQRDSGWTVTATWATGEEDPSPQLPHPGHKPPVRGGRLSGGTILPSVMGDTTWNEADRQEPGDGLRAGHPS